MSTPTPTDPREDKPNDYAAAESAIVELAKTVERCKELESTNSKLAAEIAELKAQKRPFSDKLADEVIKGQVKRITELETSLASLRAELEAVKADLETAQTSADNYWRELEAARKELGKFIELHHIAALNLETAEEECQRLQDERDTALAAKDAAEKRATTAEEWARRASHHQIMHCGNFACCSPSAGLNEHIRKYVRALPPLTPAPTQEPPAGVSPWQPIETAPTDGKIQIMIAEFRDGELIDIDFDAVLEQESESWEMPQTYWVWKSAHGRVENPTHWQPIIPPAGGVAISTIQPDGPETNVHSPGPTLEAPLGEAARSPLVANLSLSPADVPSEGRGELLPFNLSDALAGKPVVTRNGEPVTGFKETEHAIYPVFGHIGNSYAFWTKKGEHYHGIETDWDLFMLPTEGSGA